MPLQSETALSPAEVQRLRELEEAIEQGFDSFLRVGIAFAEVRQGRLYRATHPTFESYCHDRWGLSLSRCNQIALTLAVYDNIVATVPQDAVLLAETNEHTLRPLSHLSPELQTATWTLVRCLEERPSGKTVEETVSVIKEAIASGWQEREERPSGTMPSATLDASVSGQNGNRRHGHGTSPQPRMSDLLAGLVRWSHRVAEWDPEAIVAGDDEICLARHMQAARTLNTFCVGLITACNERRQRPT
jgi:hypothetical protein